MIRAPKARLGCRRMTCWLHYCWWFIPLLSWAGEERPQGNPPGIDLSEYHSVANAQRASSVPAGKDRAAPASAYLGVALEAAPDQRTLVTAVDPHSPAAKAGLQAGDVLQSIDKAPAGPPSQVRALLQARGAGAALALEIQRAQDVLHLTATLSTNGSPMAEGSDRAVLGVRMGPASAATGIPIESVTARMSAALAGLKAGDSILKVNDSELSEALTLADKLLEFNPGDTVSLTVRRLEKTVIVPVKLVAESPGQSAKDEVGGVIPWIKPGLRLAVICVEFADVRHNPAVSIEEWRQMCFSRHTYTHLNATGDQVYGSVADYYAEASCDKLAVAGHVFDWVTLPGTVAMYNQPKSSLRRGIMFDQIVKAISTREGAAALNDYDAVVLLYAGDQYRAATRSTELWPHRSNFTVGGKTWPYVITPAGGRHMANISNLCHELGHVLGLPDLYAKGNAPASTGAGSWCIMSREVYFGQPQHLCAWSKEQLGWLTPCVVDSNVRQKLILSPVEGSANECFKVLLRPDGREYLLMENRRQSGFDTGLPGEGLLVWYVAANRPTLVEAHGMMNASNPGLVMNGVRYPSAGSEALDYVAPSRRAGLGAAGSVVSLKDIHPLPDGRIAFELGRTYD